MTGGRVPARRAAPARPPAARPRRRSCGKVDDLELEPTTTTATSYVTADPHRPGHLLYRLGRRRVGRVAGQADDPHRAVVARRSRPHPVRPGQRRSASPSTSPSTPTTSPRSPPSAGRATTSSATSRGAVTMRMSDLLACDVVRRPTARRLGRVRDVRLVHGRTDPRRLAGAARRRPHRRRQCASPAASATSAAASGALPSCRPSCAASKRGRGRHRRRRHRPVGRRQPSPRRHCGSGPAP